MYVVGAACIVVVAVESALSHIFYDLVWHCGVGLERGIRHALDQITVTRPAEGRVCRSIVNRSLARDEKDEEKNHNYRKLRMKFHVSIVKWNDSEAES